MKMRKIHFSSKADNKKTTYYKNTKYGLVTLTVEDDDLSNGVFKGNDKSIAFLNGEIE